jgi:hypothetical protein
MIFLSTSISLQAIAISTTQLVSLVFYFTLLGFSAKLKVIFSAVGGGKALRTAASDLRDMARHLLENAAEEHATLLQVRRNVDLSMNLTV